MTILRCIQFKVIISRFFEQVIEVLCRMDKIFQNSFFNYFLADQLTQAVRIAKNSASKKLVFVERNHNTIFTDATVDVDRTTVHMRRMQPGGGLKSVSLNIMPFESQFLQIEKIFLYQTEHFQDLFHLMLF